MASSRSLRQMLREITAAKKQIEQLNNDRSQWIAFLCHGEQVSV